MGSRSPYLPSHGLAVFFKAGRTYLKRKASKLLLRSDKSMAGSDKGNFSWFYLSYFWAGTA